MLSNKKQKKSKRNVGKLITNILPEFIYIYLVKVQKKKRITNRDRTYTEYISISADGIYDRMVLTGKVVSTFMRKIQ